MSQTVLKINEIFRSIQGESTRAGLPCTFVRLRGCPLRCHYCDTSYAFREGESKTLEEVLEQVGSLGLSLVQITGGEPLAQPSVFELIELLCEQQYTVLIETSGVCDISACDPRAIRIVDIKTPSSGAEHSFLETNYALLTKQDEIKFVITNRDDFEWACELAIEKNLLKLVSMVHFSPVTPQEGNDEIQGHMGLDPETLSEWMLDEAPWARLNLQLHKFIWPASMRGV